MDIRSRCLMSGSVTCQVESLLRLRQPLVISPPSSEASRDRGRGRPHSVIDHDSRALHFQFISDCFPICTHFVGHDRQVAKPRYALQIHFYRTKEMHDNPPPIIPYASNLVSRPVAIVLSMLVPSLFVRLGGDRDRGVLRDGSDTHALSVRGD